MKSAVIVALLLLILFLVLSPRLNLGAPEQLVPDETERISTSPINVQTLRRMPASRVGIRACSYYRPDAPVYDIARLQISRKTCDATPGIDNKLPDRSEEEIYPVGLPFDVPKRN